MVSPARSQGLRTSQLGFTRFYCKHTGGASKDDIRRRRDAPIADVISNSQLIRRKLWVQN